MKKNLYLNSIIVCLFCVIFCLSCKQSAKSRLVGKWKLNGKATVAKMSEETKKNLGGEQMAEKILSDISVEYKKDGTYSASGEETGIWSVSEDEKTLYKTPKGKKEEKATIVEISGTQFAVSDAPNISSQVYESVK